eukprot:gene11089-23185_t
MVTVVVLIEKSMSYSLIPSHHMLKYNSRCGLPIASSVIDASDSSPLQQLLIRFDCEKVDPEEISELLFEIGTLSVSVEVESEIKNFLNDEKRWSDLGKQRSWSIALLKAFFPSTFDSDMLQVILESTYPDIQFNVEIKDLENKDWQTEVQKNWPPQIIGDLTIRFPWHDETLTTTSKELVLEGGAAFGTGDHPTTRLCCRFLDKIISNNPSKSISVLDYGCGSAILGLAALRYGASEADGVDIDKDALASAANNCIMNDLHMPLYFAFEIDDCAGLEEQTIAMSTLKGSSISFPPLSDLDNKQYDILAANILAPILIALAPSLAVRVKSGGYIALSGIVKQQTDTVIAKFSEYFNDVKLEEIEEDWVLITGIKG